MRAARKRPLRTLAVLYTKTVKYEPKRHRAQVRPRDYLVLPHPDGFGAGRPGWRLLDDFGDLKPKGQHQQLWRLAAGVSQHHHSLRFDEAWRDLGTAGDRTEFCEARGYDGRRIGNVMRGDALMRHDDWAFVFRVLGSPAMPVPAGLHTAIDFAMRTAVASAGGLKSGLLSDLTGEQVQVMDALGGGAGATIISRPITQEEDEGDIRNQMGPRPHPTWRRRAPGRARAVPRGTRVPHPQDHAHLGRRQAPDRAAARGPQSTRRRAPPLTGQSYRPGMTRNQQLVTSHAAEIAAIVAEAGGSNVRVFGSTARGDSGPDSDVDLLVDLPRDTSLFQLLALEDRLSLLPGVPVDLGTPDLLKPRLRDGVLAEAIPVDGLLAAREREIENMQGVLDAHYDEDPRCRPTDAMVVWATAQQTRAPQDLLRLRELAGDIERELGEPLDPELMAEAEAAWRSHAEGEYARAWAEQDRPPAQDSASP